MTAATPTFQDALLEAVVHGLIDGLIWVLYTMEKILAHVVGLA